MGTIHSLTIHCGLEQCFFSHFGPQIVFHRISLSVGKSMANCFLFVGHGKNKKKSDQYRKGTENDWVQSWQEKFNLILTF